MLQQAIIRKGKNFVHHFKRSESIVNEQGKVTFLNQEQGPNILKQKQEQTASLMDQADFLFLKNLEFFKMMKPEIL